MSSSKPILFSWQLAQAVEEGRKTQTRRVLNLSQLPYNDLTMQAQLDAGDFDWFAEHCPYGKSGDLLWVREAWQFVMKIEPDYETVFDDYYDLSWYPKDGEVEPGFRVIYRSNPFHRRSYSGKWRPSIHMPRWASQTTLRILGVRVERLREIDHDGVFAEFGYIDFVDDRTPRRQFSDLWDKINAKRGYSWESNPWVWVLEFEKVESA